MTRRAYSTIEIAGLEALQRELGYSFKDVELLKQALVHRSLINESDLEELDSNERLEFLGDAALGLVVTEHLWRRFPDRLEGDLTAARAAMVNLDALAERAEDLELARYVATGRGEILSAERSRRTVLGRTFEAIVGAVYVDGGLAAVGSVLNPWIEARLLSHPAGRRPTDAKSELQIVAHSRFDSTPAYQVVGVSGPEHERLFKVEVMIGGRVVATGEGGSVQRAEQQAAGAALASLLGRAPQADVPEARG